MNEPSSAAHTATALANSPQKPVAIRDMRRTLASSPSGRQNRR